LPAALLACGLAAWLAGCGSRTPNTVTEEGPAAPVAVEAPQPQPGPKAEPKQAPRSRKKPKQVVRLPPGVKKAAGTPEGPPPAPDRAAKMVAELLRPSEAAFAPKQARSRHLAGPRTLEEPEWLPPADLGQPLALPPSALARPVLPRPPDEEIPLAREYADRRLPQPVELPAGRLARVPSPDVEKPPPLPILARPRPDRDSAGDPTARASLEAALAAPAPVRTTPAAPERPAVPDPFENRSAVRLRNPPREAPLPPQVLPRTPPLRLPEKGR
jgi:hypothetical protein